VSDSLIPTEIPEPKATHNRLVCKMVLQGFMDDHLNFVAYFARLAGHKMGMPTSQVIHLPTKTQKWHVNKGPFVHAKTKEVFERKTYSRLIQVFDSHPDTVKQWIKYVNDNLPSVIDLKVSRFEWESIGFVDDLPKLESPVKEKHQDKIQREVSKYLKMFEKKK
jgi:ribosomal protein S10